MYIKIKIFHQESWIINLNRIVTVIDKKDWFLISVESILFIFIELCLITFVRNLVIKKLHPSSQLPKMLDVV